MALSGTWSDDVVKESCERFLTLQGLFQAVPADAARCGEAAGVRAGRGTAAVAFIEHGGVWQYRGFNGSGVCAMKTTFLKSVFQYLPQLQKALEHYLEDNDSECTHSSARSPSTS